MLFRSTGFVVAHDFSESEPEFEREPPAPPMVMEQVAPAPIASESNETVSIESVRTAMIANFEKEDLDVPAFLRKRTEM